MGNRRSRPRTSNRGSYESLKARKVSADSPLQDDGQFLVGSSDGRFNNCTPGNDHFLLKEYNDWLVVSTPSISSASASDDILVAHIGEEEDTQPKPGE